MKQTIFLTEDDVAELTGIRQGRDKKTKHQLQISALLAMKVPHYVNIIGRPIVARAVIEGASASNARASTWEPRAA